MKNIFRMIATVVVSVSIFGTVYTKLHGSNSKFNYEPMYSLSNATDTRRHSPSAHKSKSEDDAKGRVHMPSSLIHSIASVPRILIGRSVGRRIPRQKSNSTITITTTTRKPDTTVLAQGNVSNKAPITEEVPLFLVAVLLPFYGDTPFSLERSYGTLLLALRQANLLLRPVARIGYTITDSGSDGSGRTLYNRCVEEYTAYHLAKLYFKEKVAAYLGPVCGTEFYTGAFLASRWGLPIITPLGPLYNNRVLWPTAIRASWNGFDLIGSYGAIFEHFSWTTYFLIYELMNQPVIDNFGLALLSYAKIQPVAYMTIVVDNPNQNFLLQIMSGSMLARVFVLESSYTTKKTILLNAYDMGLLEGGEYVFITTELFRCKLHGGSVFDLTGDRIEDLKKAYESVVLITLKEESDSKVLQFKEHVRDVTEQLNTFSHDFGEDGVNPIVAGFYNALIMYATTLKKHIIDNGNPYNGYSLTNKMLNQTFTGEFGNIPLNENGDQNFEFTVWDFDPQLQNWIPAMYFNSSRALYSPRSYDMLWPKRGVMAPLNDPPCGYRGDDPKCIPREPMSTLGIIAITLACIIIATILILIFIFRKMKYEAELEDRWWEAHLEDITMIEGGGDKSKITIQKISKTKIDDANDKSQDSDTMVRPVPYAAMQGEFRGIQVSVRELYVDRRIHFNRQMLVELKMIRDMQHTNLCRFVAISYKPPQLFILMEYCSKGTLKDIITNKSIKLDMDMKTSLIRDIAAGMAYLHSSPIKYHGNLTSAQCFIDSRFSLKLSGYGLHYIRSHELEDDISSPLYYERRLYVAPELLRLSGNSQGTQKGDVYSFAIILQEIILRSRPYQVPADQNKRISCIKHPKIIIENVKIANDIPFRPILDQMPDVQSDLILMIQSCWAENPENRPNFQQIKNLLKRINKGKEDNVVDNLLKRMEMYTNNLESLVEERTGAYLEQKRKADDLLYQIMPKQVAEKLKMGQVIDPEAYDSVTIYFSDIVGFANMASEFTPFEIVTFLNDLYTCMDNVIPFFDVYKVETIGDSYMVVSGAPIPNGYNHAKEIARMSLALLESIKGCVIRHKPEEKVKLRIGIHSGPVATGVVGLKMPRYCLFGDTVNTSSRMESNGEALKIHVSPYTKAILERFDTFELEYRGEVQMKGKGGIHTYWLIGERDEEGDLITYNYSALGNLALRSSKKCKIRADNAPENGDTGAEPQQPSKPERDVVQDGTYLKVPTSTDGNCGLGQDPKRLVKILSLPEQEIDVDRDVDIPAPNKVFSVNILLPPSPKMVVIGGSSKKACSKGSYVDFRGMGERFRQKWMGKWGTNAKITNATSV